MHSLDYHLEDPHLLDTHVEEKADISDRDIMKLERNGHKSQTETALEQETNEKLVLEDTDRSADDAEGLQRRDNINEPPSPVSVKDIALSSSHESHTQQARARKKATRKVSFSHVEIRDYALIVIDHPSCPDGLGLSLDWKHTASRMHYVEEYTQVRDIERSTGRTFQALNAFQRKVRLKQVGGYRDSFLKKAYLREDMHKTRRWRDVKLFSPKKLSTPKIVKIQR